jgi:protein-tyrosine phosphatase
VRILTVCTGNICRSPVAERLLQAGLDQVMPGGFVVTSAGTRAMVGDPMQPLSGDIVRTYGGNPDGFVSRQLTSKILRGVDLVLTMTSGHRGEVLQLDASLLKRTFTIREFARMLEALEQRDAVASVAGPAGPGVGPAGPAGGHMAAGQMPGGQMAGVRTNTTPDAGTLWRGLPARLASVRHLALAADSADNEVIDPYKRSPEVYRQMEDELAPAILTILRYARLNTPT